MSILDKIIETKKQEIAALKATSDLADMSRQALKRPLGRGLEAALRNNGRTPVIAEIKRSSPSAGVLNGQVNVRIPGHSLPGRGRGGGVGAYRPDLISREAWKTPARLGPS